MDADVVKENFKIFKEAGSSIKYIVMILSKLLGLCDKYIKNRLFELELIK
ncbi:MAG: hypothetical protein ACRC3Y_09925 [Romboutsia sp.]